MQPVSVILMITLRVIHLVSGQHSAVAPVICAFAGKDYQLIPSMVKVIDLPKGCTICKYGQYDLNSSPEVSTTDMEAINELRKAHKSVYIHVKASPSLWVDVIGSIAAGNLAPYNQHIPLLERFIKKHQIAGVILDDLGLFDKTIVDYATHMNSFIDQLKIGAPGVKVGLMINGASANVFGDTEYFNFGISKKSVDLYVIDMAGVGLPCNPTVANSTRFPLNDNRGHGVEYVTNAVRTSGMDTRKTIANFLIETDSYYPESKTYSTRQTYGSYCQDYNQGIDNTILIWCKDRSQSFVELAKYARLTYYGMMLSHLDYDDWDQECSKCEKFQVTEIFLESWINNKTKTCPPYDV